MKYFFAFESELPADGGFPLFGACHLAWLVIIIGIGIAFVRWYCRQADQQRYRIQRILGIGMPVIALYRDIVLMLTGHWGKGFLPLHLCGMALWIAPLYIFTKRRWIGVIYVTLCSPLTWILQVTGSKWYRTGYFIFCICVVALWMLILQGIAGVRKWANDLARRRHV